MEEGKDEIVKLETDIDDSTGEALGYTIDRLMQAVRSTSTTARST